MSNKMLKLGISFPNVTTRIENILVLVSGEFGANRLRIQDKTLHVLQLALFLLKRFSYNAETFMI
jgi:hypothetical protein